MMPIQEGSSLLSIASLLDGYIDVSLYPQLKQMTATGLSLDSRTVGKGDIFFALRGTSTNGLRFVKDAIAAGAIAVVHEEEADEIIGSFAKAHKVPLLHDADLVDHLGKVAARFYGDPSRAMQVIATTGTDGKTSVANFIAQALDEPQHRSAIIGTIGNGLVGQLSAATHTTPDAISLQALLAAFCASSVEYVSLEASSHGLLQGRLGGVNVRLAVLTNLAEDHLDYHGDVEAYQQAKQRLFELPNLGGAVLNWNDEFGRKLLKQFAHTYPISIYGLGEIEQFERSAATDWVCGQALQSTVDGLRMAVCFPDEQFELQSALLGGFNAMNLLATAAVLRRLGWSADKIINRLSALHSVPGRMQLIKQPNKAAVVIDYAHTPQALQAALCAVREHCQGKLWCVFGCGGNRDKTKRPKMGAIASAMADHIIITNDNPRHEAPEQIAVDIQQGIQSGSGALVILDRVEAIAAAISNAQPEDLILVAGKGHECTQTIGDEVLSLSDQQTVLQILGVQA